MTFRQSASAAPRADTLSVETLQVGRLIARTPAEIVNRGRGYYRHSWRFHLQTISPRAAVVRVQGTRPYHVEFELTAAGVLLIVCDCPYADYDPDVICKHKVAAALFLQDYLAARPPETWETTLKRMLHTARQTNSRSSTMLFFSLQQRGAIWSVVPYTLPASLFPEAAQHDVPAAADVIRAARLSSQAKPCAAYSAPQQQFINVTPAQAGVVNTLAAPGYYSYYGGLSLDAIFTLLADSPLFFGSESDPLQFPLAVLNEVGSLDMEMRSGTGGITLRPLVAVAGETLSPADKGVKVVSPHPLWLLAGARLFRVTDLGNDFASFQRNPEIFIPASAERTFLERHLVPLAERFPLRGDAVKWETMADVMPVPRLYLTEEGQELQVRLRFAYGPHEVRAERDAPATSIHRNGETGALIRVTRHAALENGVWTALGTDKYGLKRGPLHDVFVLRAKVHPFDFLTRHVPQLTAAGFEIFGEEDLKLARINRHRPTISFGVTSGIDWFDVNAVVRFGDVEVALKDIRKSLRKRERFIKLADGSIGEIPAEWLEKYKHLFALADETDKGLRVSQHHLTLLDQLLAEGERVKTDREFEKRRQLFRNFKGIREQKLPKHFDGELRPYQKAGFDWLHFLREHKFGGCLADDMGTGKTIQALVFLQSLKERRAAKHASLLVVPRSLVGNWEREAARFAPQLKVLNHAHPMRGEAIAEFDDYDLVLTTYGVLRRDIAMLRQYEFDTAILDEAQAIKNPLSETAKAARLVRAHHRLTLTGTPVENNTLELWSQFAFLNPGLLGNVDYFREEFAGPIERRQDQEAAQLLRRLVFPFILRRTKDQVAKELPPRSERQVICEMEPAQRKLYEEKRDYYRAVILELIEEQGMQDARFRILEGLLRLRQICNHPRLVEPHSKAGSAKFEVLRETLETLHAEGHKALVFSQFVQTLKLIETELKQLKLPYTYLDGKTKDRQARVDAFQEQSEIPFFLISLKAGGVGLNLTAADYVIHVDPWWNPAVEMQATDRTHRIGQEKPVFVYKLIVKDSVEEKILQLQERKRALVTQLISTESSFFKSLTRSDIESLFS